MKKRVDNEVLRAIRSIWADGISLTTDNYTEEQWEEIVCTFEEMYSEFVYRCK